MEQQVIEQQVEPYLGQIHQGDCIEGLQKLPDGSVHLVFADPPFNIGYDYDEYDDRQDSEKYLEWCHRWMRETHRVLRPDGTFWLAIGDEYAAELKVEAQKVGFHARSWVVWYYTFGVHCKTKFTRSHAHLFYFVKDPEQYTFLPAEIAVPSARQLVYGDKRANPNGRMPDDTWILRPQDCVDSFNPDEDTWYFPRVNGTFKERAGFHGCQMPEQLLGRIVRSCSRYNDIVLDPFSGSSTTLVVAKKLGRRYLGFELSKEYVRLGTKRLDSAMAGDRLEGSEEPKVSAPATNSAKAVKRRKGQATPLLSLLNDKNEPPAPVVVPETVFTEADEILEAFMQSSQGYSVDRLVADPELNDEFQHCCDQRSVPGSPSERNRFLFRMRKSGKLKQAGISTTKPTEIEWSDIEAMIYASEIAWRRMEDRYVELGLDEILCDPRLASAFDDIASQFAPGRKSLEYRWAAIRFRKELDVARHRVTRMTEESLDLRRFAITDAQSLSSLNLKSIAAMPGIYALRHSRDTYLYIGETDNLASRFQTQFSEESISRWLPNPGAYPELELLHFEVPSLSDLRLVRQLKMLAWYPAEWNMSSMGELSIPAEE